MISRNGPCSPPHHNPPAKKISQLSQSEKANSNSDASSSSAGYMEYIVTIGVGTPKADFTMLVDTGSDNTWVRCKPCTTGCSPNAHLFDPSKSSTYVKGSPDFQSFYGDNSSVNGVWGYDTLTVDKSHVVKKFQFGCGQDIHDEGDDNNNNFGNAAGMLGLGQGELSLPSQGGSNFKTFSYCLPKSDSEIGYLVFGNEAHKRSSSFKPQFTPLLPPPKKLPKNYQGKSYYFVELIGISVAGKQLDVDPSVFTSPGTIIDSGTSITQLPPKAYSALATAFNQSVASKYPAAQSKQKPELDTCYNVDGSEVLVPDVTLRFGGGVDVALKPSGIILIPPGEPNLVCLGFTQNQPDEDLITIIGNHQQRQMGMVFDLQGKRVGFGTTDCAE